MRQATLATLLLLLLLVSRVAAEVDAVGTDFWVAWPETTDVTPTWPGFDADAELILLTDDTSPAPVTVTAPGLSWTGDTSRGTPARVRVPLALKMLGDGVVENKGIRVVSDNCVPIAVLFRVPATGAAVADDVMTVLPLHTLGTTYYPDTYHGLAEMVILATADATTVSWDNPHCPGPTTVRLDRGEAVQHKCPLDAANLAERGIHGTRVDSDRPVAVFGGSAGSKIINYFVPLPSPLQFFFEYSDILLEQMRPVDDWERELRTAPFHATAANWAGDFVRVLASCDGTAVDVDDGASRRARTLQAGEAWDLMEIDLVRQTADLSRIPLAIRADRPIQVSQFAVGNVNAGVGDPAHAMVPGLNRAGRYYHAYLPEDYESHVTIVAPASAWGQVAIDGTAIPPGDFQPYPDRAWGWTRRDGLPSGQHLVTAPTPLAVTVHGTSLKGNNPAEGAYAYPAPSGRSTSPALITSDQRCSLGCPGACVTLDAGDGYSSYRWSTGDATRTVSVCPLQSTAYTVELTDPAGCSHQGTITVPVQTGPVADAGPDVTACGTTTLPLGGSPTASGGTPPFTYRWAPPTGLSDPAAANPDATVPVSTTFTVTVTDDKGCVATDAVDVTVTPPVPPPSVGNTLRMVKLGDDVRASWVAVPDAAEYLLRESQSRTYMPASPTLQTSLIEVLLSGVVPAPPSLLYYWVVGLACDGSEGL